MHAHDWFSTPGPITDLGTHRIDLPTDASGRPAIADVTAVVQGLVVYNLLAQPFYGVELAPERVDDIHVRTMAELLDLAVAIDDRPLSEPRPPEHRVAGRCHTYARLTVAILRAHGVADAGRYGLSAIDEHGAHWIAHNMRLDVASLAKQEMTPWDGWGAGWEPDAPAPHDLSIFDTMCARSADPDATLDPLLELATTDHCVRVPDQVWNALRQQLEPVPEAPELPS